jgi:hypothetical protein
LVTKNIYFKHVFEPQQEVFTVVPLFTAREGEESAVLIRRLGTDEEKVNLIYILPIISTIKNVNFPKYKDNPLFKNIFV